MYFIVFGKRRFNNKNFPSYEEARKYVRRTITARFGKYADNINAYGFSIQAK